MPGAAMFGLGWASVALSRPTISTDVSLIKAEDAFSPSFTAVLCSGSVKQWRWRLGRHLFLNSMQARKRERAVCMKNDVGCTVQGGWSGKEELESDSYVTLQLQNETCSWPDTLVHILYIFCNLTYCAGNGQIMQKQHAHTHTHTRTHTHTHTHTHTRRRENKACTTRLW